VLLLISNQSGASTSSKFNVSFKSGSIAVGINENFRYCSVVKLFVFRLIVGASLIGLIVIVTFASLGIEVPSLVIF